MVKKISLAIVINLLIFLLAHSSLFAEEESNEINIINTIGTSVSWGRKYFFDAPRFKDSDVQELLNVAIEEKLKTYGIQIIEGGAEIKFVLNYTLLLGETATKADIEELYEQFPELKEDSEALEKIERGKLLISIRDRDTNKPIWKNSVEGFANLDMPKEVRQKRVNSAVDQVFESFPAELQSTH